jgi:hypothetical protein
MKSRKRRTVGSSLAARSCELQARREIKNFLRALSSYPDRFARDPYLSFEQHLFAIAAAGPGSGEVRRRD